MDNGNNNNFNSGIGTDPFGGSGDIAGAPSGEANTIFNQAKKEVLNSGNNSPDSVFKPQAIQYEQELKQNALRNQFATTNSQMNIGDLRKQIAQNVIKNQQAQADGGFSGGGGAVLRDKQLSQQAGNAQQGIERKFENQVQTNNTQSNLINAAQRDLISGSNAMAKQTGQYLSGQDDLTARKHSDNWFVHFLKGLGGYSSATNRSIDWDKVAQDGDVSKVLKNLGVDTSSDDDKAGLNELVQKATTEKGRFSPTKLALNAAALAAGVATGGLGGGAIEGLAGGVGDDMLGSEVENGAGDLIGNVVKHNLRHEIIDGEGNSAGVIAKTEGNILKDKEGNVIGKVRPDNVEPTETPETSTETPIKGATKETKATTNTKPLQSNEPIKETPKENIEETQSKPNETPVEENKGTTKVKNVGKKIYQKARESAIKHKNRIIKASKFMKNHPRTTLGTAASLGLSQGAQKLADYIDRDKGKK